MAGRTGDSARREPDSRPVLRWLPFAAAAIATLACGGWLAAQQLYRDVPLWHEPPPTLPLGMAGSGKPAEFVLARMAYTDRYKQHVLETRPWQIDSPAAERHLLQGLARLSTIDSRPTEAYVRADEPQIFDYPFLYVVEAGHWALTDSEVEYIREYLLRGGFIMFDDFHGSEEWTHFMGGIRRIFPDRKVEDLETDNEVFHVLFDMDQRTQIPGYQMVFSGRTYERDGEVPHWRGIRDDSGRLMVLINHNMDLGDAWEHADWPLYPERLTAMSYRLAINYIIYAMTH